MAGLGIGRGGEERGGWVTWKMQCPEARAEKARVLMAVSFMVADLARACEIWR